MFSRSPSYTYTSWIYTQSSPLFAECFKCLSSGFAVKGEKKSRGRWKRNRDTVASNRTVEVNIFTKTWPPVWHLSFCRARKPIINRFASKRFGSNWELFQPLAQLDSLKDKLVCCYFSICESQPIISFCENKTMLRSHFFPLLFTVQPKVLSYWSLHKLLVISHAGVSPSALVCPFVRLLITCSDC